MVTSVALAALLLLVTVAMHTSAMALVLNFVRKERANDRERSYLMRIVGVSGTVLFMFIVSVTEAMVWAVAYLSLGAIEGVERAVYFSMVTFTTLGYGDIVVDPRFRLLASFEAANGSIMFGWTTAIVLAVVRQVYRGKGPGSG